MNRIRAVQQVRSLRSWKEIASYLGVSVRTAQVWEKQSGLPVHRLPGGARAGVYAQTDELDQWYRSSELEESKAAETSRKPEEPRPRSQFPFRKLLFLIPALSVVVAIIILGAVIWPPRVATVELRGTLLIALDGKGATLWTLNYPDLDVTSYPSVRDWPRAEDLDSDGVKEVLFSYRRKGSALPGDSKMICLNSDGSVRWEFPYGRRKKWGSREFAPVFGGRGYTIIKDGNRTAVMTMASHAPYFPAQVAFIEPREGKVLWEYWHPGHLVTMLQCDLDGDSVEEILLGGMNNPGQGLGHPALVVLKSPFRTDLPPAESWASADSWGGNEFAYLLFPRNDIADSVGIIPQVQWLLSRTDGLDLGVGISAHAGICASLVYTLSFGLEVRNLRELDCFRSTHDYMEREGKLDHSLSHAEVNGLARVLRFKTAPDANSPQVAAMWEGLSGTERAQR